MRAARYWYFIGDLDEAARAGQHALKLARTAQANAALTKTARGLLLAEIALLVARTEQDRDNYAAGFTHLTYALSQLEPMAGTDARDRLLTWTLIGLGENHRRVGRYPQAIETLYRAIRLADAVAQPQALSAALTERGITAKELGEFDHAAELYARVREIHRESGGSDTDSATLEHNLSGLEYARKQYSQAESHARQALARRRRASGVSEVDVAADLAVLAATIAAQHRHDEAREMFEQALRAGQAARPPRRYEIAVHLHGLADLDHSSGRADRAETRYREALALKEELLGTDHPEVGLVAANLGTLLDEQHRGEEAADLYRRALTIAEQTFGPDHSRSLALRDKLGMRTLSAHPDTHGVEGRNGLDAFHHRNSV